MALLFKSGTYTGDAQATKTISGIGFQPKWIFVWSQETTLLLLNIQFWFDSMPITGNGSVAWMNENGVSTATTVTRFTGVGTDGWTITTGSTYKNMNTNNITYYYVALGGDDIYTGTYTGNATNNRSITDPNFTSELVFLCAIATVHQCWKTTATGASTDTSKLTYNGADVTNRIKAITSTGFTLGTGDEANKNLEVYYYACIKQSTAIKSVRYTGDGNDNRSIAGVGFQPEFVWVKSATTRNPQFKSVDMAGDTTKERAAFATNRIQALESDGIQIGTDATINTNAETYDLIAFRTPPASSGNIKKINNIAWANVKKINGIPVANIKKVNGITA